MPAPDAFDASIGQPTGLRGSLGRRLQRLIPDLDERAFFRARRADIRARERAGVYDDIRARHPRSPQRSRVSRPPHVVVVPQEGKDCETWGPGHRNFYFEAATRLAESPSAPRVSVFHVGRGEPYERWHPRLIDYLNDSEATHLLTHIESDPGSDGSLWTWDSLWNVLPTSWGGVLLGVMFDSAYRFTNAKSRLLAQMSDRFVVVDICMPMNDVMVRGRPEVGPVNMPMSSPSLELLDRRLERVDTRFDVSFVGVLYPYRLEMLERLREAGFSVAVNPHRNDNAADGDATRRNQPSWLDYMAGLASSSATINFSQSNARPVEQLKTRVIEAGLAGTLLLTDDVDRTRRFWLHGIEYGSFSSVETLPGVIQGFLDDPNRLLTARRSFADRARRLAEHHFWGEIERVLALRSLPTLGIAPYDPAA